MCIKPKLQDIIIGDKSFKDCESKKVVMCLPLTHITKVNGTLSCSTYKCSDAKNLILDLQKYLCTDESKEVLKSGAMRGYCDSELYSFGKPYTKWTDYSFIIRGVSFNSSGNIGFIIETLDTLAGRTLADRLVCDDNENLHLALSVNTIGDDGVTVSDLLSFRII